jgi:tetratricopeptide (TPR) repeat protein
MTAKNLPRVFIQYAQDPVGFKEWVQTEIADRLRASGFAVLFDQLREDKKETWPQWSRRVIAESDFVIVVCSEANRTRIEGNQLDGEGKGATFEGELIVQDLYNSRMRTEKYLCVLRDRDNEENIPPVLRGRDRFWIPSQFDSLVEELKKRFTPPDVRDAVADPALNRRLSGPDDSLLLPARGLFLGRDEEVKMVLDFLERVGEWKDRAVAMVSGAGGTGKTELCKAALRKFLAENPDQTAYHVHLAGAESASDLLVSLAQAIGHPEAVAKDQLLASVIDVKGVIYLDNLESVLEDEEAKTFFQSLTASGARILSSSRQTITSLGKFISIGKLPDDAAVELFRQTWENCCNDPLDDTPLLREFVGAEMPDNYDTKLKWTLGRHALSIVLVAAHAIEGSLNDIIERWVEEGTDLAKTEIASADNLRSLAMSIRLTLKALPANYTGPRLMWGLAALFPDGMSDRAWKFFTKNKLIGPWDRKKLFLLNVLFLKEGKLHILPPLARFAIECAQKSQDGFSLNSILDSCVLFFKFLSKDFYANQRTARRTVTMDAVLEEFVGLHRFMLTAINSGGRVSAADLFKICNFLQNLIFLRTVHGKEIYEALTRMNERKNHIVGWANAEYRLANLEELVGQVDSAKNRYLQAATLFEKKHSDIGKAKVLDCLADLEARDGEIDAARDRYLQAIALSEKARSDLGRANALSSLAELERRLGEIEAAKNRFFQAIALFETERSDLGKANALTSLANLEREQGEIGAAKDRYLQAIALFEKERDDLGKAHALLGHGHLERGSGDLNKAEKIYDLAFQLMVKVRAPWGQGDVLRSQGELFFLKSNPQQALEKYNQAKPLFEKGRVYFEIADLCAKMALVQHEIGDDEAAKESLAEARDAAKTSNLPPTIEFVEKIAREIHGESAE